MHSHQYLHSSLGCWPCKDKEEVDDDGVMSFIDENHHAKLSPVISCTEPYGLSVHHHTRSAVLVTMIVC